MFGLEWWRWYCCTQCSGHRLRKDELFFASIDNARTNLSVRCDRMSQCYRPLPSTGHEFMDVLFHTVASRTKISFIHYSQVMGQLAFMILHNPSSRFDTRTQQHPRHT